jgi:hypothetical protein
MDAWYRVYQRLKLAVAPLLRGRVLSLEIHNPGVGFFAHLSWCTAVLDYCDQRKLTAQLSATSPQYRDRLRPANWLSYFFEVVNATPHVDFRIAQFAELCMPERYRQRETIERTHELVNRHLPLKEEIRSKLERLSDEHFRSRKVLGVHFRGTDKALEAVRVDWEAVRETISNYLRENSGVDAVFVATDEPAFVDFIHQSFPRVPLLPSYSGLASAHHVDLGSENYRKGEEALLDCLMLSHCSALIRTTSFLSAWASIFNPRLPIVLLNRPYSDKLWFPESALIPRSMDRYLARSLLV